MSSFRGRHAELLQLIDDVWNGGDVGTLEPTGKRFEIGGIEIFRIVGGKTAEVWIEYDLLGLLPQLGALAPR